MKRIIEIIIGGIGFGFYFVPVILGGIANVGTAAGMFFFGAIFLWGVFRPKLLPFLKKKREKKPFKIVTNIICVFIAAVLAGACIESAEMLCAANKKPPEDATVIVLGCGVNGTKPSKMLRTRINAAEKYLKEHPDTKCIVSGGQGDKEDISEAECMFRELTAKGIEAERIYLEYKSTSTRENIRFSKEIIDREGLNTDIAVVTNEFHELRASMVAKDTGLKAASVPAATPWGLFAVYWTREMLGIAAEFVF